MERRNVPCRPCPSMPLICAAVSTHLCVTSRPTTYVLGILRGGLPLRQGCTGLRRRSGNFNSVRQEVGRLRRCRTS